MVQYNQLPVYRDVYQLLLEIFQTTGRFSKDFKYSLGQDMKRDALGLFRELYCANTSQENRTQHIDEFLRQFEMLKIELRLCVDLNVISIRKLAQLTLLTDSIGKQVTAWRKKSKMSTNIDSQ